MNVFTLQSFSPLPLATSLGSGSVNTIVGPNADGSLLSPSSSVQSSDVEFTDEPSGFAAQLLALEPSVMPPIPAGMKPAPKEHLALAASPSSQNISPRARLPLQTSERLSVTPQAGDISGNPLPQAGEYLPTVASEKGASDPQAPASNPIAERAFSDSEPLIFPAEKELRSEVISLQVGESARPGLAQDAGNVPPSLPTEQMALAPSTLRDATVLRGEEAVLQSANLNQERSLAPAKAVQPVLEAQTGKGPLAQMPSQNSPSPDPFKTEPQATTSGSTSLPPQVQSEAANEGAKAPNASFAPASALDRAIPAPTTTAAGRWGAPESKADRASGNGNAAIADDRSATAPIAKNEAFSKLATTSALSPPKAAAAQSDLRQAPPSGRTPLAASPPPTSSLLASPLPINTDSEVSAPEAPASFTIAPDRATLAQPKPARVSLAATKPTIPKIQEAGLEKTSVASGPLASTGEYAMGPVTASEIAASVPSNGSALSNAAAPANSPLAPAIVPPVASSSAHTAAPASPNAPSAPPLSPAVEQYVEQVADAREAGRSARPELTLRHGEFGTIGLRIEASSGANANDWRATLVARDPGFVPAVQAALAERMVVSANESGFSNPGFSSQRGGDTSAQSAGSQGSTGGFNPGSQGSGAGSEPRYGSSTGSDQGSAKPYSGEEGASGPTGTAADTGDTSSGYPSGAQSGALFA